MRHEDDADDGAGDEKRPINSRTITNCSFRCHNFLLIIHNFLRISRFTHSWNPRIGQPCRANSRQGALFFILFILFCLGCRLVANLLQQADERHALG